MIYLLNEAGQRVFHTVRDRLGDTIRVYRGLHKEDPRAIAQKELLRQQRIAREAISKPRSPEPDDLQSNGIRLGKFSDYEKTLKQYGSARKAATALGISARTFGRRLAAARGA